jgi:hypothetical protein
MVSIILQEKMIDLSALFSNLKSIPTNVGRDR